MTSLFSYDDNSNLKEISKSGNSVAKYDYDVRNQLTKAKDGQNNTLASFDYDFERKRLTKTGAQGYQGYVYAGNQVVNEYNAIGAETARYTIGAGEVVKSEFANGEKNYHLTDALGSVTSLANATNGSLTSRSEYNAFGEQTGGSSINAIGYTGQRLDNETGLMALGNGERYYSPTYARFIQQDSVVGKPMMPQSLNRFAYGLNNPNKFTDPSGHIPTVVAGAIIGAIFGAVVDAAHQAVDIYNGDQKDGFHFGQTLKAAAVGAAFGAIIGTGVGALALLGYGAAATVGVTAGGVVVGATSFAINAQDGRYAHGAIDLGASLIPFGSKGVRGSFGEFYGGGYSGGGAATFRQNLGNFQTNGGFSQFKQLFTGAQAEVLQESKTSIEPETKQLTDGGKSEQNLLGEGSRSNQKLLGDNGVQERIESGRLLKAAPEEQFPTYETPNKPLSRSQEQIIKIKVSERTATRSEYENLEWNRRFNNRRQRGVDRFWSQEKRAIRDGKQPTRNYTESQKQELLNSKKPTFNGESLEGHHRYNALDHPQLADKPWNIYPTTENEHLYRWHGGNFRNDTFGEPLDPNYEEDF